VNRISLLIGVSTAVVVAVGLGGSALAAPSTVARPSERAAASALVSCHSVEFIGVRGSGETQAQDNGYGSTIWAVEQSVTSQLPEADTDEVDYPAIPVVYPTSISKIPSFFSWLTTAYHSSEIQGIQTLVAMITGRLAACPNTYFLLAGYSQGAQVVGDTFISNLSAAQQSHVAGIAMLGDPDFNGSDFIADQGTYDPTENGFWPASNRLHSKRNVPAGLKNRVRSYCMQGDPVCNFGVGNLLACANNMPLCPHFAYASMYWRQHTYAVDAADYLVGKYHTAIGNWAKVSAGSGTTCAIRTTKTLWCWGNNYAGEAGTGDKITYSTPSRVGTASDWATVSTDGGSTCAIRTNGTLWCWGANDWGQLGTGNTSPELTPTQVGTANNWSSVSTSYWATTCATRTNGTLWCWGDNGDGQVGIGNRNYVLSPVRVGNAADWATVSTRGYVSVCATRFDGTLWCWGDNDHGQLGNGSTTSALTPTQVGTATGWATVSSGLVSDTCAIRLGGTLWCWGGNWFGQLGLGDTADRLTPTRVGTAANWHTVFGGDGNTCATTTSGALWCWGENDYGQLGTGNTTATQSPVQVGQGTTWISVSSEIGYTCGIDLAGSLWCWGYNAYGQLGTGDTVDHLTPVQINW
jgi:alpha-tubulin suppressor-like RCC1 family protein